MCGESKQLLRLLILNDHFIEGQESEDYSLIKN